MDREGRGGGLVVVWKKNFQCQVVAYSQNYIDMVVEDGERED